MKAIKYLLMGALLAGFSTTANAHRKRSSRQPSAQSRQSLAT